MPSISGTFQFGPARLPHGEWPHREPGLAMALRGMRVWSGAAWPSPSTCAGSGLVVTLDGRIDNAAGLRLRLGEPDLRSDEEVALAVFRRWGTDGLELLVGDWSVAVWDRRRRTLYLARDYMGARPLYYHAGDRAVDWSGDLAELVERCARVDVLSDAFAAHYMSLTPVPALTPYEGVHAVAPGVCLAFSTEGGVSSRQLWTLRAGRIRSRDPRAYEEELRRLWSEAVGARLSATGTVWAEVSGGLDSSSVVCMADRLIRCGLVPARAIGLISHATLHSPEGDERRFIAEVERQVGVRTEIVGVEAYHEEFDSTRAWLTPYALQGVGLETVRRVHAAGGQVVLSGRLGDAVMGCQPDNSVAVFDDVARLDLAAAIGKLRAWSRATRKPFVELAWRLFVPERGCSDSGTELLTGRLRAMLRDVPPAQADLKAVPRSKRTLAGQVLAYVNSGRLAIPHHAPDTLYTYPFAHRPLVEFVLAIPGEQLSSPGDLRSLMRRAFRELLPPRILNRASKGYYPPAAYRAARAHAASLLDVDRLETVSRGWIDADRLRASLRSLTDGGGQTGADIHRVLRLERWLQSRQRRAAISPRKEVNSDAVLNA